MEEYTEPTIHTGLNPPGVQVMDCDECESPLVRGGVFLRPWIHTGLGNFCVKCAFLRLLKARFNLGDSWRVKRNG